LIITLYSGEPKLESLKDERMEGNYQKATPEYVNKLMEVIDKDPK
jgi:hypothetical protein